MLDLLPPIYPFLACSFDVQNLRSLPSTLDLRHFTLFYTLTMAITTPEQKLAVAEIAIFTLYFLLGAFCIKKHGKPGRIGWLLFLAFCVLRVTANGLSIHPKGSTGAIINSVGISALILTTLGVTHEW